MELSPQQQLQLPKQEAEKRKKLEVIVVSDTHGQLKPLKQILGMSGDIFIHAGDFTDYGREEDFTNFFSKLERLKFKHKIVIAGNHEISLDNGCILKRKKDIYLNKYKCTLTREQIIKQLKKRCIYLEHQSVTIEGITIFGSPYTPYFVGNAFQYPKCDEKHIWDAMPQKVDLLVTHCPPYGILDKNAQGKSAGSQYLRDKVLAMKPKYHVFGHIHESMGVDKREGITFINAAMTPTRLLI